MYDQFPTCVHNAEKGLKGCCDGCKEAWGKGLSIPWDQSEAHRPTEYKHQIIVSLDTDD